MTGIALRPLQSAFWESVQFTISVTVVLCDSTELPLPDVAVTVTV
jgi:hypothetical protein